jgi:hypothetical protein
VVAGGLLALDTTAHDTLTIRRVDKGAAPVLDGNPNDPVWQQADAATVLTRDGANLPDGQSRVELRAVADDTHVYFRFRWQDPTRSLKHLPLEKTAAGWQVRQEQYDIEDEDAYYEDKFAVMLARDRAVAGGVSHLGPQPLSDKPKAFSGRGLHYTVAGEIADLWHWKAVRGGLQGWMDDNHFGPPANPKPDEVAGRTRYKAGYQPDAGTMGAKLNFKAEPPGGYHRPVTPSRLPRDVGAVQARMGRIDLDPASMTDAAWAMDEADSIPYSPEHDAAIPVGTVIPGVLLTGGGRHAGGRGDVRAGAAWADGHWLLEVARPLDTGGNDDVAFRPGDTVYLWVSVFDRTQTRHSRHVQPVAVELMEPRRPAAASS